MMDETNDDLSNYILSSPWKSQLLLLYQLINEVFTFIFL